jgi:hypothetical protein
VSAVVTEGLQSDDAGKKQLNRRERKDHKETASSVPARALAVFIFVFFAIFAVHELPFPG